MEKSKKPKTKVYASCEHDYVSYKDLHRLCSMQHTYIKNQDKVLNVLKDRLREYHEKHSDCLEKNQELLQAHHEITRAYNGLHEMGKFAEALQISFLNIFSVAQNKYGKCYKYIKETGEKLTIEDNKDYKFEQEHKLLESGRVQHIYKIKKDKEKTND